MLVFVTGRTGARTWEVVTGTNLATADEMLRVLRAKWLVTCERDGHWLSWSATRDGRRAAFVYERTGGILADLKLQLEPRLSRAGLDHALRHGQRRLGLGDRRTHLGVSLRDARAIEGIVNEMLDRATGCR